MYCFSHLVYIYSLVVFSDIQKQRYNSSRETEFYSGVLTQKFTIIKIRISTHLYRVLMKF
jgi:hypothetical protein